MSVAKTPVRQSWDTKIARCAEEWLLARKAVAHARARKRRGERVHPMALSIAVIDARLSQRALIAAIESAPSRGT